MRNGMGVRSHVSLSTTSSACPSLNHISHLDPPSITCVAATHARCRRTHRSSQSWACANDRDASDPWDARPDKPLTERGSEQPAKITLDAFILRADLRWSQCHATCHPYAQPVKACSHIFDLPTSRRIEAYIIPFSSAVVGARIILQDFGGGMASWKGRRSSLSRAGSRGWSQF